MGNTITGLNSGQSEGEMRFDEARAECLEYIEDYRRDIRENGFVPDEDDSLEAVLKWGRENPEAFAVLVEEIIRPEFRPKGESDDSGW